jgi:hypothetical protein
MNQVAGLCCGKDVDRCSNVDVDGADSNSRMSFPFCGSFDLDCVR